MVCNKIINYVSSKGGKVINIENYKNNTTKLNFKCNFNHEWSATWSNIKQGRWCPYCAKNKKLSLEFAKNVASKYQAKLLSTEYKNSKSKLHWQCKFNHLFWMNLNSINNKGNWCPNCSFWSSEEICRKIFNVIFNQSFNKKRPEWLVNDSNIPLELDGLSESKIDGYHLAFEHQGEQHYKNSIFTKSLEKTIYNDQLKLKLCNDNNIILIQIPQLFKLTKLKDLQKLIKNKCKLYIDVSNYDFNQSVNLDKLYTSNENYYNQIKNIIINNGGKLISDSVVNCRIKIQVICNNQHIFWISPNSLKNKQWCSSCSHNKKLSIEEMKELAFKNNGKCLSDIYVNSRTKLHWYCNVCKYDWHAKPYSIKNQKSWCPKCKRK